MTSPEAMKQGAPGAREPAGEAGALDTAPRDGGAPGAAVAGKPARPEATGEAVESSYHYRVVARAIEQIERARGPLPLGILARQMGMSPAHFQRVFTAWVGISPKRLGQYLALGHARALLRARHSTLEAAMATGLSGTGRLHDLFLRWEAMRPGEYARGGGGLTIRWGRFASPFGPAIVMATDRGICGIGFAGEAGEAATLADLSARWPAARLLEDHAAVRPAAEAAFGLQGEVSLHLIGAPFQIKVWEALLAVPEGHVTTYSDIARAIGAPRAVRAVGTAVGRNPVSWLIPCHRALRKTGGLGGYHWGVAVKRAMLFYEQVRAEAPTPPER